MFWVLFTVSLVSTHLFAQTSAEITGRVTDASKAVVPGATVTATNIDRRTSRTTTSNDQGYFILPSIDKGNYEVTVQASGFKPVTQTGLKLDVNQSLRLDFSLEVGAVSEKIQVVGDTPLLEVNTAQLGTVVTEEKISELPLNARNFTQLLTLTPGAAPVSVAQNAGGGQTTPRIGILVFPAINGQSNRSNSFTLDGVYNNGHFTGTYSIAPNIDALSQFKVQSHSDQAEFGGVTGGTINIATKIGTNEFHGSVYEFLRNDALDARGFFTARKPPLRQNQFGAAVGGPLIRNKTFFHASYEGYRQRNAAAALALVPTPAELSGDFSTTTRALFDPYSTRVDPANANRLLRDPFPGNRIPGARLSPSIKAFADAIIPNPINTGFTNSNARNDDPQTFPSNSAGIRVDHYLSARDSAWFRYSWSEQNTSAALALPGTAITGNIPAKNLGVGYTHTFGPATVLTGLFGFTSTSFFDVPVLTKRDLIADGFFKGFPVDPRAPTPGVNLPGFFGLSQRNRQLGPQRGWQGRADLSHNIGSHSLKFGGEFVRQPWTNIQITEGLSFNTRQTADLNSLGNTGSVLASFVMGLMESSELSQADFTVESQIGNFFVQDSWKVTDKLTVNLGLRWDIFRAPDFSRGFASTWDFNTGRFLVGIDKPPGCTATQGPPCLPEPNSDFVNRYLTFTGSSKLRSDQLRLPGPRIGVAYRLRPRTVVRGSYAVFYDLMAGVNQQAQNGNINNANWPGFIGLTRVSNINFVDATADLPFGTSNVSRPTPTPNGRAFYYDPRFS
ncbi:MAG: TonB-dependent receptor, partial [Bryobacterales bacterium]|nr:TonB-dependent receptor [Bryobacterales bacterium]